MAAHQRRLTVAEEQNPNISAVLRQNALNAPCIYANASWGALGVCGHRATHQHHGPQLHIQPPARASRVGQLGKQLEVAWSITNSRTTVIDNARWGGLQRRRDGAGGDGLRQMVGLVCRAASD